MVDDEEDAGPFSVDDKPEVSSKPNASSEIPSTPSNKRTSKESPTKPLEAWQEEVEEKEEVAEEAEEMEEVEEEEMDWEMEEGEDEEEEEAACPEETAESVGRAASAWTTLLESVVDARLTKSSKEDSTSAGSFKYSEMKAFKQSSMSFSKRGTISSRSVASLEGEIGGVGMVKPNFFQTASVGVEKSTFSRSASSKSPRSPPSPPPHPIEPSVDATIVDETLVEAGSAAVELEESEAKSVSDTVELALEA